MIRLTALACGLLCGIGLVLSGMTDPDRLRGFLDVTGDWDPTFGLGLLAALVVAWAGTRLAAVSGGPLLGGPAEPAGPPVRMVRLVAGSLLVGLGLGLTGFAPGTALAASGLFSADAALFVAAVLCGMLIQDVLPGGRRFGAGGPHLGRRLSRG
jgi:uncharacterized membrane protein YedE/YeeE